MFPNKYHLRREQNLCLVFACGVCLQNTALIQRACFGSMSHFCVKSSMHISLRRFKNYEENINIAA